MRYISEHTLTLPLPNPIGYTILLVEDTRHVRWAIFSVDIYLLDLWGSVLQPAGLKLSWKTFWGLKNHKITKPKPKITPNPTPNHEPAGFSSSKQRAECRTLVHSAASSNNSLDCNSQTMAMLGTCRFMISAWSQ